MVKSSIPAKNSFPARLKDGFESFKDYLLNVYSELKKVHWPDRKQVIAYTGIVILAVALVGLIIWLFDNGLSYLLNLLNNRFA